MSIQGRSVGTNTSGGGGCLSATVVKSFQYPDSEVPDPTRLIALVDSPLQGSNFLARLSDGVLQLSHSVD